MTMLLDRLVRTVLIAAAAAAVGCSVAQQDAPSLVGPSGPALGVTVTASPDTIQRDGSSTSVITVAAYGADGQPVSAQRFRLSASAGTLSGAEVVTGANGQASLTLTAPSVNEDVSEVIVVATSMGNDSRNDSSRSVRVSVLGSPVPVPAFTWAPATPAQFELVEFDGSTTRLSGAPCPSCTYTWTFGPDGTGTGIRAQHRFQTQGPQQVMLTVTAPSGTTASSTQTISVGTPVAPTAAFTFSPTNPTVDEPVNFNASGSQGANGAAIVSYAWNFGNGETPTTTIPTTTAVFRNARSYAVTLVVTDSRGRTATTTQSIAVASPPLAPTAAFTFSPTNPKVGDTVYFNASGSRGALGAAIVEYRWEFGNGTSLTTSGSTTSVVYGAARTFTATLVVVDANGRVSPPLAQTITVAP
jgi:PKD repeat protein